LNITQQTSEGLTAEKTELNAELESARKVSEVLSLELSNCQAQLDTVSSQLDVLQDSLDKLAEEHAQCKQEKATIRNQLETTQHEMEETVNNVICERQKLMEENIKLSDVIRQLDADKSTLQDTFNETNEKLKQAERIHKSQCDVLRTELNMSKSSSELQATMLQKKCVELKTLTKRIQELEDEVGFLKVNHDIYESQYRELVELRQQLVRSDESVRQLLKERVENEQMIGLLEMQKTVLTQLVQCRPSDRALMTSELVMSFNRDSDVTDGSDTDCKTCSQQQQEHDERELDDQVFNSAAERNVQQDTITTNTELHSTSL
jgi:chromosome segregation ATPase